MTVFGNEEVDRQQASRTGGGGGRRKKITLCLVFTFQAKRVIILR